MVLETLLSNITLGQIQRIPCKFIKGKTDAKPIVIHEIAQKLQATKKNVLPVIIRVLGEDKYQAILHTQVLEAARKAKLDFVWCIVIDEAMEAQIQVETGHVVRVNILTAKEQEMIEVLELIKAQNPGFRIDPKKVARAIVEYRQTQTPINLNFLTRLKCGIGKAKLPLLKDSLVLA